MPLRGASGSGSGSSSSSSGADGDSESAGLDSSMDEMAWTPQWLGLLNEHGHVRYSQRSLELAVV
jgi:hypothetical protein